MQRLHTAHPSGSQAYEAKLAVCYRLGCFYGISGRPVRPASFQRSRTQVAQVGSMGERPDRALRLLLQFVRAHRADDPYAFRFDAPQDYILQTPGGESLAAPFDWTPEVRADLVAVRLPGRDPSVVQRMGTRLRAFIQNAFWARHEREIAEAIAAERRILLTIRSSAAEIYALPWELMALQTGQMLCEVDGLLLRYEWPGSPCAREQPTPRPEGGRILFAWSGEVPADAHRAAIAAACTAGGLPFSPASDELPHASVSGIVGKLDEAQKRGAPISVLHLLCHGGPVGTTYGLCLSGERVEVVVDAIQLRDQLAPFASMVRLVVLSACDSGNPGELGNRLGSIAQALHRCGFEAVIASRFPLSVAGSAVLTRGLYGELLSGPSSLETAFLAARMLLARSETALPQEQRQLDWASVQLFARHEDADDLDDDEETRPIIFRPYRGMLPFQPEHERFFCGREREVQQILTALRSLSGSRRARLVAVVGDSGVGKSSIVSAGVMPRLLSEKPPPHILQMRPGQDPVQTLNKLLSSHEKGSAALLAVEHFEEVFTETASQELRTNFVKQLWECATSPDSGLSVLVTLRSDFVSRCDELAVDGSGQRLGHIVSQAEHQVRIAPLEREKLREVIVEPARRVGLTLEAHLVDDILGDVGTAPGALPLLQDALNRLWENRCGSTLTKAAYIKQGGVIGPLVKQAEDVVGRLATEERELTRRLLLELVAVAEDAMFDQPQTLHVGPANPTHLGAPATSFERLLPKLVTARLLVQGCPDKTVKDAAEIAVAHAELIRKWPRLLGWLDADRAGLLIQKRVRQDAKRWSDSSRAESLLYQDDQLTQDQAWRAIWEPRLREQEKEFLRASDARKERRRRFRLVGALAVAAVLAVTAVLAIAVHEQKVRADQQERLSRSMQLVAKSAEAGQSPDRALLLAVEARRLWDSPYARSSLLSALQRGGRHPVRWLHGAARAIKRLTFAPQQQSLLSVDTLGSACAWDLASGRLVRAPGGRPGTAAAPPPAPMQIEVAPDGSLLALISRKAEPNQAARFILRLGRAGDGLLAEPSLELAELPSRMRWSPDGRRLALVGSEGSVRLWNVPSGVSRPLQMPGSGQPVRPVQIENIAWSADGELLAGTDGNGRLYVWTASSGRAPVALEPGLTGGVRALAFGGPSSRRVLAASGGSGTLALWGQTQGGFKLLPPARPADGQASPISLLCLSPDGTRLAAATESRAILLFETVQPRLVEVLPALHGRQLSALAFSRDGSMLASADERGAVVAWDLASASPEVVSDGEPREQLAELVISRSHSRIAWVTPEAPEQVRVRWIGAARGEELLLPPHPHLTQLELSADGQQVVTASALDGRVRVWNLSQWRLTDEFWLEKPAGGSALVRVRFSRDGLLLGTQRGSTLRFRDLMSRQLLPPLPDPSAFGWDVAPAGRLVALDGPDGGLVLWDVRGGQPQAPALPAFSTRKPRAAAFLPDGRQLLVIDQAEALYLIDLKTRQAREPFSGSSGSTEEVEPTPDGHLLAVARTRQEGGAAAHVLQLWDVATGHQIGPDLLGHSAAVISQLYDPDRRTLSSADQRGAVLRWDLDPDSWTVRACRTANRNLTPHEWSSFVGDAKGYRCTCPGLPPPPPWERCPGRTHDLQKEP